VAARRAAACRAAALDVGSAEVEVAANERPDRGSGLTSQLRDRAIRCDLLELLTWALVYQAEAGDRSAAAAIAVESVADPVRLTRATAVIQELSPRGDPA
jgi:hypothetical protein